jgi:hypothetical protein
MPCARPAGDVLSALIARKEADELPTEPPPERMRTVLSGAMIWSDLFTLWIQPKSFGR